ncbi:exodeoxyribonuclease III [Patescibacteria group bacterium]|nr:exodeoxyribonuclease III [Patescibacteria group bacterium]
MLKVRIVFWNVNGIRAGIKKGLWNFVKKDKADIYCFAETKAKEDQLEEGMKVPAGYYSYWNSADKAGYSGVVTLSKMEPKTVIEGNRDNDWDEEGRVLITKFDEFTLLNVYFPNGKRDRVRLDYKLKFYEHFLEYVNKLRRQGEKVIWGGDVNTAHQEIDLARPKENEGISGFLPIERKWLDKVEQAGWLDSYRLFYPNKKNYSWWSMRSGARGRNVGWRIDYVFVDEKIKNKIKKAFILDQVEGSDHCPVGIEIEI